MNTTTKRLATIVFVLAGTSWLSAADEPLDCEGVITGNYHSNIYDLDCVNNFCDEDCDTASTGVWYEEHEYYEQSTWCQCMYEGPQPNCCKVVLVSAFGEFGRSDAVGTMGECGGIGCPPEEANCAPTGGFSMGPPIVNHPSKAVCTE